MVIKGGARGGPGQLADHLLRTDHNERVNVLHMKGIDAPDLYSALQEMHAIGKGARSKRTLYHANIDPRADERMTSEQNHTAVERLAERLGLADQPYVVVEHVKHGRHHLHVVWSRIDLETMTAVPDSHNFRKHEEVSAALALEFGHEQVQGAHHNREGKERPSRTDDFTDHQQAARAGTTPKKQKAVVTQCWQESESGAEFRQRLDAAGFLIARGDRRDFVLVDHAGAVHSLARKIDGANAKEVRQRMGDLEMRELPSVIEAREQQAGFKAVMEKRFVSAVERLRTEEQQYGREEKATPKRLSGNDSDLADAIFRLKRTMRGEVEATIANSSTDPARPEKQGAPGTETLFIRASQEAENRKALDTLRRQERKPGQDHFKNEL